MAYRDLDETVVRELLERAARGEPLRRIARETGLDRKTVRRYVTLARAAWPDEAYRGKQLAAVAASVAHALGRSATRVTAKQHALGTYSEWTRAMIAHGFTLAAMHRALVLAGVDVSYATFRRFVVARLGWSSRRAPAKALEAAKDRAA